MRMRHTCRVVPELHPGDVLRRLRKSKGYKRQADLATAADVSRDTYGKAERGEKVSDEMRRRIARTLGVDLDTIWEQPVSPAIHRTAQIDTKRAGVPSVSAESPAPSNHADPRKADVLEEPDMRDLELYVRGLGMTPEAFAQWKLEAAAIARDWSRRGLQSETSQPKSG